MAYYGFGEYYTTPSYAYAPSYDIVPFQDSVSYSNEEPKFYEHYPGSYSTSAYDPFPIHSEIHHSMYRSSDPLLIEYNPISSYTNHFSPDTQYTISYSTATAEVDDTHYDEYDPTPYDGGYDPTLTYGKPLSPSTDICYPRSSPVVSGNSLSPEKVAYGSIPSPYGVDEVKKLPAKPSNVAEPVKSSEEKKQEPEPKPKPEPEPEDGPDICIEPEKEPDSRAGYGYGVGVIEQAPRVPYGSGLEAMDICETLFGYWPCLEKQKRMNNGNLRVGNAEDDDQEKQWRCAADYLFGRSPSGYGGFEGGNYWEPTCNYERHYQRENHIQVENSWLLNSSTVYSESSSSSW